MKHIVIVGGGITGLIIALTLYRQYKVTVIDAASDPKLNKHTFGATYSSLDARHISYTETTPWTAKYRSGLIVTDSKEKGWLCLPKKSLNDLEKQWILEFQNTANTSQIHDVNTEKVIAMNKKGVAGWEGLQKEYSFLSPVVQTTVMPVICRNKADLIGEFDYEHSLDKRVTLYKDAKLPESLSPFKDRQKELGDIGYFTLYGIAYHAKTICLSLIHFLQSQDVSFAWNTTISESELFGHKSLIANMKADAIVWCSGISNESAEILSRFNILFAGVVGGWIAIENPGITIPCKIYGPEPVNYINITPKKNLLLLSGGYGFVGTRAYDESVKLASPIIEAMIDEVKKWFPKSAIKEKAVCVRPATPTGVPTLLTNYVNNKPFIIAVGHCAGGFTQAPITADGVKKRLDSIM